MLVGRQVAMAIPEEDLWGLVLHEEVPRKKVTLPKRLR